MNIDKAKRLVEACYRDQRLLDLYAHGDHLSRAQTKHDIGHAFEVRDVAADLTAIVQAHRPELLSDWTMQIVIPLGAFLHDIGRAIDVEKHDSAGAAWAQDFLRKLTLEGDDETLPSDIIKRVVKIIACHRAHRYVTVKTTDPALDIVVIADKCVGDEDRVRDRRAAILRVLTWFRLSWIPLRRGGIHDRANFAIKNAKLAPDGDELVLHLKIDERVCKPALIYNLYGDRFQSCSLAAFKLGFAFRLEFNGARYAFDETQGTFLPSR